MSFSDVSSIGKGGKHFSSQPVGYLLGRFGLLILLAGLTIKATRVETGITILAMRKKKDDTLITNPSEEEVIKEGDQVIVIGTMKQLDSLGEAL